MIMVIVFLFAITTLVLPVLTYETQNMMSEPNNLVPLGDEPFNSTESLGWELLDDGKVFHMWNQYNDYYFNRSNGVQFSNHYEEYWTHNVLMLGYYAGDSWNLLYRTDELSGFTENLNCSNNSYINVTLWKDLSYDSYDFRLAIRYHLKPNDTDLTIVPYIKNLGISIPFDIGFGWEMKDIRIADVTNDNYLRIYNNTSKSFDDILLNQSLNESFTNLDLNTSINLICKNPPSPFFSRNLYLSWNHTLNYKVICKSRVNQTNAPTTLFIKVGTLNVDQEKYTVMNWLDADDWLGITSAEYDDHCGDWAGHTLEEALDGDDYWDHNANEDHWFVLDLGDSYDISKVRGRSKLFDDPIDVNVYIDDSNPPTTLCEEGITTWVNTNNWVEIVLSTPGTGRYIKVEIEDTEDASRELTFGDNSPTLSIFDAYGEPYIFGDNTTSGYTDIDLAFDFLADEQWMRGLKVTTGNTGGTLDNITAYLKMSASAVTGNVKCALYEYQDGTHLDYVAETDEQTVNSRTYAWYTFTFSSPPVLTASTDYVLVAWGDHPSVAQRYTHIYGLTSGDGTVYSENVNPNYDTWDTDWDTGEWTSDTSAELSIYGSYTEAVANNPPTITGEQPTNGSTGEEFGIAVGCTVTDGDAEAMNVTFATSPDGSSWTNQQTNTSVASGSGVNYTYTGASSYSTKYYWKVMADDGTDNTTGATWDFTTKAAPTWSNSKPNATGEHPTNGSTEQGLGIAVGCTVEDGNLNHTLNVTFASNYSDGSTWVNYQTNSTDNPDVVNWTFSGASSPNIKYWYRVFVHDGFDNTTWTFYYTTVDYTPDVPTGFTATNISSTQINLAWTKGTSHVDTTYIERNATAVTAWPHGTGDEIYNSTAESYSDTGLDPDTHYYYQAWSYNITQNVYSTTNASADNTTQTAPVLYVSLPFPINNSATVLTGIGNLSVNITGQSSWNISLYDNASMNLQASAEGAGGDGVKYCDVNSALYFAFNKSYTWYVNISAGISWDNNTYYFTTFNGSGFLYIDHYDPDIYFKNLYWDGDYLHVVSAEDDGVFAFSFHENRTEELWLKDIDATAINDSEVGCDFASITGNSTYIFVGAIWYEGIRAYTFNQNGTEEYWLKGTNLSGYGVHYLDCNETLIFGALGGDGIKVMNFTDETFNTLYTYNPGSTWLYVYWDDINKYLYATENTDDKVHVFSWDGNTLTHIDDEVGALSASKGMASDENYLYVAGATSGVLVYSFDGNILTLEYTHRLTEEPNKFIDITILGDNIFVSNDDDGIYSYRYEGGSFIFQDHIDDMTDTGDYCEGVDNDNSNYIFVAGMKAGVYVYGYELLRVAPPTIDIKIAGNPVKDSVTRDGVIRYVNQSYNNETFCNITANITVPNCRTLGRYFRTTDDNIFVATGNLSDDDSSVYADEGNHSILASRYECTYTGDYSQVSAFIAFAGHNTVNLSYAIYTDSSGEPDALLAFTEHKKVGEDNDRAYDPDVNHVFYPLNITYDATGSSISYIELVEGQFYWLMVATYDNGGYIEDIYWILGNSLGDTSYVRNSWYNISSDMNFSNVTGESWVTTGTNNAHYLCIYAIANNTNNAIPTVDINSATVSFYNGSWEDHSMSNYAGDLWTVNLTGLTDDSIWHTFNITAIDELGDEVVYTHYRLLYRGWDNGWDAEDIVFKTDVPCDWTDSNASSDLYSPSYVLYLWEHFYDDTLTFYGDGEHLENVLPHEQGVDGSAKDTGRWTNQLPGDEIQERYCFDFSGGFWDENITIESELEINNVYIHWWCGLSGHTVEWDRDAIHLGRSNTTYDLTWLGILGWDEYFYRQMFPTNSSTKATADIVGAANTNDPVGNRLICLTLNVSNNLADNTFDSSSIYQFFMGEQDNQTSYEWDTSSGIFNNRSYLTYIIFNVPDNATLNASHADTDSDGLSDWTELYRSFTHPFINDTDGDGVNDSADSHPNNYTVYDIYFDNEYPTNSSTSIIQPTCHIDVYGTQPLTITFASNSTGSWVNYQTNTSVNTGDTVYWEFTGASTVDTTYYWQGYRNDTTGNNVSEIYHFTTRPAIDVEVHPTTWNLGNINVGISAQNNFTFYQNGSTTIDITIGVNDTNFTFVNYADWLSLGHDRYYANFTIDSWSSETNIEPGYPPTSVLESSFSPGSFVFGIRIGMPRTLGYLGRKEDFVITLVVSEST